jgi:hypothetical protein
VDFGSDQGRSEFETGGVACYVEDFKRARTPVWAKRCYLWMGNRYSFEISTNIISTRVVDATIFPDGTLDTLRPF